MLKYLLPILALVTPAFSCGSAIIEEITIDEVPLSRSLSDCFSGASPDLVLRTRYLTGNEQGARLRAFAATHRNMGSGDFYARHSHGDFQQLGKDSFKLTDMYMDGGPTYDGVLTDYQYSAGNNCEGARYNIEFEVDLAEGPAKLAVQRETVLTEKNGQAVQYDLQGVCEVVSVPANLPDDQKDALCEEFVNLNLREVLLVTIEYEACLSQMLMWGEDLSVCRNQLYFL